MSRSSLPRPTLLPGLRPLWRDRHTVQLGTDPAQAVVLELPHPSAARLLDLLDGSHTERAIAAQMARIGMSGQDVHAILAALVEAGLVVAAHTLMPSALPADHRRRVAAEAAALALRFRERPTSPAAILRRRYSARVIIAGEGPFARLLTPALIEAGVGTVGHVTEPGATATIAPPHLNEATKAVESLAAGGPARVRSVRADAAFVVQIGRMTRVALRGARHRLPHLALNIRDGVALVGPLVPTMGGPCLRCIDLHRTDRDPAWPRLAAQLAETQEQPIPCTAATILTATGLAAAEVLTYIDGGEPSTIGTTVEINGNAPWRRRTWPPHPLCDCTRRR